MYKKWHPTELMEFAKTSLQGGKYNLGRSSVPSITNLSDLPGSPFEFHPWGINMFGHEGLKVILSDWYCANPENILIAQGTSQANFLMAGAILADGGTAIVEAPTYQPILCGIQVFSDQLIRLPRRKENLFQPEPEEFRKLLTSDTKLVWL